jgi:hypothetical protein
MAPMIDLHTQMSMRCISILWTCIMSIVVFHECQAIAISNANDMKMNAKPMSVTKFRCLFAMYATMEKRKPRICATMWLSTKWKISESDAKQYDDTNHSTRFTNAVACSVRRRQLRRTAISQNERYERLSRTGLFIDHSKMTVSIKGE